jgi:hypothetical protein
VRLRRHVPGLKIKVGIGLQFSARAHQRHP